MRRINNSKLKYPLDSFEIFFSVFFFLEGEISFFSIDKKWVHHQIINHSHWYGIFMKEVQVMIKGYYKNILCKKLSTSVVYKKWVYGH